MRKMTQAEFSTLKRNKDGYLVIPYGTDCTEIDFGVANRVILGNCCVLGNRCKLGYGCKLGNGCTLGDECTLGDWCVLGDECKLGNGCTLGDECTLGEYIDVRATFEDGRVQDGLYVQIGNIGSEHRTAYFYIDKDGAMFVRAGCWFSGMEDFKVRVKSVHSGTIYEVQYMAACAYAEAILPLMLKESDAARKEQHDINEFLRKYRMQCNGMQIVRSLVRCKDCSNCRKLDRTDKRESQYVEGVLWCTQWDEGVYPDDFCSYSMKKEIK